VFDEAGGRGPRILIRRVWIGEPPEAEIAAQMQHYRSYAPERAMRNWGEGDSLVQGRTGAEAAEMLAATLDAAGCDTVNVRIHVKGLEPGQVRDQIERLATEFLPHLRRVWPGAARA
jgi:hypothetical protein